MVQNVEANEGGTTLNRTERTKGFAVTATSAEGLVSTYATDIPAIGSGLTGLTRTITAPDATVTRIQEADANISTPSTIAASTTFTLPDGTVNYFTDKRPDPRLGMSAAFDSYFGVKVPSGLKLIRSANRSATLADKNNPFSQSKLINTFTTNGNTFTQKYDSASATWTDTSAAGRIRQTQIDPKNRPLLSQTAGLNSIQYSYDARGRLATQTQSSSAKR